MKILQLGTVFSPCRRYRYTLWRQWWKDETFINRDKVRFVQFIGLNPSTADEQNDDPTVRRCINYAQAWGYDAICMTNAFAFRATNPKEMLKHELPIGEASWHGYEVKRLARHGQFVDVSFVQRNDAYLCAVANGADLVVAAWGNRGAHMNRAADVVEMIQKQKPIHCLRITGAGEPEHPLYLKKNLKPIPYEHPTKTNRPV